MTRLLLLALALAASGPAAAQFGVPADPCPLGTAEARLRGAFIEAALFTNGNLFFGNETTNDDGYLAILPGSTGPSSLLFAANLWFGGLVDGEVRTAAARYSNFQFRPGLTGADRTPPAPTACAEADRIWVVSRDDIARYLAGDIPTADLAEWPVHLGAPVLDGDGIPGNYDLAAGDQPALRGDVTAFWAMTDAAAERPDGEFPLGVDVTAEAFALRSAQFSTETFYRLTITNRNAVPIRDAYAGLFLSPSVESQMVGTDTTAHMLFFYGNGYPSEDEPFPAFGAVVAEGPVGTPNGRDDDRDGSVDEVGERLTLTATRNYYNGTGGPQLDPSTPTEFYRTLRGLWLDGAPLYEGGYGRTPYYSDKRTTFTFPGDPVTGAFWSMVNTDGDGTSYPQIRRSSLGTGPFRLAPDSSTTVTFAIAAAQGDNRFDSVRRLRARARGVRAAVLGGDLDPARVIGPEPPPTPLVLRLPSPNPFRGSTALRLDGPDGIQARVTVYDALGRRVAETEVAAGSSVDLGAGLTPGVYVVRVAGFGFDEALTVTKLP